MAGERADHDSEFDVMCYVDSLMGVAILDDVLGATVPSRRLPVLLELGFPGGRAGVRSINEALDVALAVTASRHLVLRGTSGFEGIITDRDGRSAQDLVCDFLWDLRRMTAAIDRVGAFEHTPEVVVSAGGSAYFDHVVNELRDLELARPIRLVLRSGCYLTHSDGGYDLWSPMGSSPRLDRSDERLRAAMEVWGAVLSHPEPGLAIVGIGRRDVSPDAGMPLVREIRRPSGDPVDATGTVVALNDQHAYLEIDLESHVAVGDLVSLGVSHPCTTFDKWRAIPMVDDDYQVTRIIHTYF